MAIKLGLDAKLYIDDEASYVSPTWSEVTNCKDLTLTLEKSDFDVTVRGNNGWRAVVSVLKDGTLEFKMIWDTDDANFVIIKDAFLATSFPTNSVNIAAMDGDILTSGSEGLRSLMIVSTFTRNEPLEEALTVDVKLRPTYFPAKPTEWLIVS
jgi:hypothetical protein